MTSVLLVGTGQVGARAARQLVDIPGLSRLVIASRDAARARELAEAMGANADVLAERPGDEEGLPVDVDAVAIAIGGARATRWVRRAIGAGVPVAAVSEIPLGELEASAHARGVAVVGGCALAPGMTDVLARHAAAALDTVDEVHIARVGASGPACVHAVREARHAIPGEWRDGSWHADRGFGPELLWFPEPVGARECQLVSVGVAATVATVPTARHVTSRLGALPAAGRLRMALRRDPVDGGWGAARVEVSGWRDGVAESIVYGIVDRTAVVAGVVLAVSAAALAGLVAAALEPAPGVRALGEVVAPVPFLTELSRWGVRAAAFEGVVPS